MAKHVAFCLLAGVLVANAGAANTCAEDEMDLCVDYVPSCSADEMDLCWDIPPPAPTPPPPAPPTPAPTKNVCLDDEMDLCVDLANPVCSEDEMDLCVDFVPPPTPSPLSPPPKTAVTFMGTFTFKVEGTVTKVEVEIAAKKTLEQQLHPGSEVFVTATMSSGRRLATNMRQLAENSWSVAWQADVPAASAGSAETNLEAMEADTAAFQEEFKKQLVEAGCEDTVAASLSVKSFVSEKVDTTNTTALPTDTESTDGAFGLSGKFSIALAIVVSTLLSPNHRPLSIVTSMVGGPATC